MAVIDIDRILSGCNSISKKFYTSIGLLVSEFILCLFIAALAKFFLQFDNLDKSPFSFLITAQFYIAVYIGAAFLLFILWFIKRSVPKFKKGRIGILFGPAHTGEISSKLQDLSNRLNKEVKSKDFAKIISIKTLPPNIEVGEHSKNIEILNKAGASLIICGNFENFTSSLMTIQYGSVILGERVSQRSQPCSLFVLHDFCS